MIVMQYYPHGSLFDLLQRARKGNTRAQRELTWGKRLDMLRDVAAGMHYLHSRRPSVIHGDLRWAALPHRGSGVCFVVLYVCAAVCVCVYVVVC